MLCPLERHERSRQIDNSLHICYASLVNLGDIQALWYITHINNLPSILVSGILCHNEAEKVGHVRVDNQQVNDRRSLLLPNGRTLHDYANLYFNPRNAMMLACTSAAGGSGHLDLALVGIHKTVMQLEGVLATDMNAAVSGVRIAPWTELLPDLVKEEVFTRNWWDKDERQKRLKRARAMAEVLVPSKVVPKYIIELAASSPYSYDRIARAMAQSSVPLYVRSDMFWNPVGQRRSG